MIRAKELIVAIPEAHWLAIWVYEHSGHRQDLEPPLQAHASACHLRPAMPDGEPSEPVMAKTSVGTSVDGKTYFGGRASDHEPAAGGHRGFVLRLSL